MIPSHLLTHSAGMIYEMKSDKLQRYRAYRSEPVAPGTTVPEKFSAPLLYEPGTGWLYSTSIDWAGKLIERVTGQTLEEYVKAHIWGPLGTKDITFFPHSNADIKARMTDRPLKDVEGEIQKRR